MPVWGTSPRLEDQRPHHDPQGAAAPAGPAPPTAPPTDRRRAGRRTCHSRCLTSPRSLRPEPFTPLLGRHLGVPSPTAIVSAATAARSTLPELGSLRYVDERPRDPCCCCPGSAAAQAVTAEADEPEPGADSATSVTSAVRSSRCVAGRRAGESVHRWPTRGRKRPVPALQRRNASPCAASSWVPSTRRTTRSMTTSPPRVRRPTRSSAAPAPAGLSATADFSTLRVVTASGVPCLPGGADHRLPRAPHDRHAGPGLPDPRSGSGHRTPLQNGGWPQAVKATCASIESVGSRRPCGAIVGSGAGTGCGTGRGGCAVLAAPSGGAEISVRDLPGGEAAEATAGTGADPVAAAAVYS